MLSRLSTFHDRAVLKRWERACCKRALGGEAVGECMFLFMRETNDKKGEEKSLGNAHLSQDNN